MNFLCICQFGHCRSVALARELQSRGQVAVAIGYQTSGSARNLLCRWADKILVLQTGFENYVPDAFRSKVIDFNVGVDRWVNPYHPQLRAILKKMVDERLSL